MNALGLRICCGVTLFLLTGCAHQLHFCVTDASSGSAIPAAEVTVRDGGSFSYFYRKAHLREVGSTDTNGLISVRAVGTGDTVFFDAPGHHGAAAGFVGRGKVGFGPNPPHNVDTMYLEQKVVDSAGTIIIPLLPLSNRQ